MTRAMIERRALPALSDRRTDPTNKKIRSPREGERSGVYGPVPVDRSWPFITPRPSLRGVRLRVRMGPVSWLEAATLAFPGQNRSTQWLGGGGNGGRGRRLPPIRVGGNGGRGRRLPPIRVRGTGRRLRVAAVRASHSGGAAPDSHRLPSRPIRIFRKE